MQYGYFDDSNREYVISTPHTPLPWINYLGSEGFFSIISNTGGGYSFYKDAKLRRLTRYRYNGVPADTGSRFYYIKDGDCVWSPGFLPAKTELDSCRCRHGLGYTVIEGEKDGIGCSITFFVPLGSDCELNYMKLTNHTAQEKRITVFSAVELSCADMPQDPTWFVLMDPEFVTEDWSVASMPFELKSLVVMDPEFVATESAEATMPWEPLPFVTMVPLFAAKEFVSASIP